MRLQHDLLGCANRSRKVLSGLQSDIEEVEDAWKDETARKFLQRNVSELESSLDRLIVTLQLSTEEISKIASKIKDDKVE